MPNRDAPADRAALRTVLQRRARRIAAVTVTYDALEAAVSMIAGRSASSIALVGFSLDSLIEMSSAIVILWQFRHPMPEHREKRALRLIAWSFFALAAYVLVDSAVALLRGATPEPSMLGIAVALTSLVVMPTLSMTQRRTGRALASAAVVADSKQTLLCTYLSLVLLTGLLLNAQLGWWWADPLVGLAIVGLALHEGLQAWRGNVCMCLTETHIHAVSKSASNRDR